MNIATQSCPLHGPHQVASKPQAILTSDATNVKDTHLNLVVGDYVGKVIQGQMHMSQFRIERPCWYDEELAVAPAFSDGELFEAQLFGRGKLPQKLYLSRKRRMQRLKKSRNFVDMSDQGDVKIFFSRVPKERNIQDYRRCMETNSKSASQYTYSIEDFPSLPSNHGSGIPNAKRNLEPTLAKAYSSCTRVASQSSNQTHTHNREDRINY